MAFAAQRRKPGEYGDMTGITQERVLGSLVVSGFFGGSLRDQRFAGQRRSRYKKEVDFGAGFRALFRLSKDSTGQGIKGELVIGRAHLVRRLEV